MKTLWLSVGLCLLALLAFETLRSEEPSAEARQRSVTVFPVIVTPSKGIASSFPGRIAEVVGVLLERGGMEQIELSETTFTPPDTDNVAEVAAAFGQFVQGQPLKTEYAVFGQFFGTPKTGPTRVRAIAVDKTGNVILADQAGRDVLARGRPKPDCPMTTSIFLVSRLRPVWDLADPLRAGAPEGKIAKAFREQSGVPSDEEFAAMKERLKAMKDKIATVQVTVYPIHLWPGWDETGAARLAELLNQQGICAAVVASTGPDFTVEGDPNEQKVLWSMGRSFREFVRDSPPATQYALLVDYGLGRKADGRQSVNHVHLILCERTGDWVLVDYQNSHHPDFQRVDPKTVDDCNRLAVIRLKNRLSE